MYLLNSLDSQRRAIIRASTAQAQARAYAGFTCHTSSGVVTTSTRDECCSKYGFTCPDGTKVCYNDVAPCVGHGQSLLQAALSPNQGQPPGSPKVAQPGTSAQPSGNVAPQDADCQNFGGIFGGVFDQACVAGKGFIKGLGVIGGPCIPGVGIPCWMLVIGGIIGLVIFSVIRRR